MTKGDKYFLISCITNAIQTDDEGRQVFFRTDDVELLIDERISKQGL